MTLDCIQLPHVEGLIDEARRQFDADGVIRSNTQIALANEGIDPDELADTFNKSEETYV